MSRILIADDQRDVLEALRILLKGEGYQTDAVTSLAGIFSALGKKDYALLIMDLNYTRDTTSGQEGLEVIPRIQALDNTLPIVVMTAWATIDLAVEAMKRGRAISFRSRGTTSGCSRLCARRSSSRVRCEKAAGWKRPINCCAATRRISSRSRRGCAGAGVDFTGRAVGRERSYHGRKRHRQRSGRARAACAVAARIAQHDHGEHGRTLGRHFRELSCSAT